MTLEGIVPMTGVLLIYKHAKSSCYGRVEILTLYLRRMMVIRGNLFEKAL